MNWQPIETKPTECGWYAVWICGAETFDQDYYDTDKGWMIYRNNYTHWMQVTPPKYI